MNLLQTQRCQRSLFRRSKVDGAKIAELRDSLDGIKMITDLTIRGECHDRFWRSHILRSTLNSKFCDLIALPRNVGELKRVLANAYRLSIPVTCRGAGTGTKGQSVALEGGVMLSLRYMNSHVAVDSFVGRVVCDAGLSVQEVNAHAKRLGWELRVNSTSEGTIGGYLAKGGYGSGSIAYGALSDFGNISKVHCVTVEENPCELLVDPSMLSAVIGSCGTTCVMTRAEIVLAPSHNWNDIIFTFENSADAIRFALEVAFTPAIEKKQIALFQNPLPYYYKKDTLKDIHSIIPPGHHSILLTVAYGVSDFVISLGHKHNGKYTYSDSINYAFVESYCWEQSAFHYCRLNKANPRFQNFISSSIASHSAVASFMDFFRTLETQFPNSYNHVEFASDNIGGIVPIFTVFDVPVGEELTRLQAMHFSQGPETTLDNPHSYQLTQSRVCDLASIRDRKKLWDPKSLLNTGKIGDLE